MILIPFTSDGERVVSINTGKEYLTFRTYYSTGQAPLWLLDISDADANPLICGIALVPGADNALKGHGNRLEGYQLYIFRQEKDPGSLDAPGKYLHLLLYTPGEDNLFRADDPMLTIGRPGNA